MTNLWGKLIPVLLPCAQHFEQREKKHDFLEDTDLRAGD